MKRFQIDVKKSLVLVLALLLMGSIAGLQTAQAGPRDDDDCDAPVNQWKPRDAVRDMAQRKGWQIDRLKIDDGCYVIRGQDAGGQRFKAKIDPVTLDVVRMKRADGDHGKHGDYRGHGDRGRGDRRDRGDRGDDGRTAPEAPSQPGPRPQVEIR
ncbi:MAG: PepSY domain-containing protein [Burkholderiaceae bacterium]|jgi:hypothetical protein|nr:PepSY domain-containing protein [Burkholderiaceae bacterium]